MGDNIAMLTHDTMRKLKVGDRVMVDTTTKYKDFNVPGLVNNSLGTIIKIDLISVYNSSTAYMIDCTIKWDTVVAPYYVDRSWWYIDVMLSLANNGHSSIPNRNREDLYTGLFNTADKTTLEDIIRGVQR